MKKFYLFLFNFSSLLWLELIFYFSVFSDYLATTILSISLFLISVTILNTLVMSLFNKKVNFAIGCVIYSLLGLYFSTQLIFKKVFESFFQISLISLGDQLLSFGGETIKSILSNFHYIILCFVPLIVFIIIRKKIDLEKILLPKLLTLTGSFMLSIGATLIALNAVGENNIIYKLVYKLNDNAQNIERLGVLSSLTLDVGKTLTKFEEEIIIVDNIVIEEEKEEDEEEEKIEYGYNTLDIDFSTGNNKTINNYMKNDYGTKKNEYTGIFEGKNIVYVVAESFHTIGVSQELTPTLYSLINDGFKFENFYTPNNLSTIGGEFQAITGLYPDNTILKTWRSGNNTFPNGLAKKFKEQGYNTYAYHNNSYAFQDRHKYLKSQGFTNYKGCYNGMEKLINCKIWPQSDLSMFDKTTKDYIDSEKPFLAYYMTVSGHMDYTRTGNTIVNKNYKLVKHLDYSERVKGFIATQIELDKALELLIQRLEEKGKLEDTVIVLLADHYPYRLETEQINEVSTYKRDGVVGVNHNSLIIWNSEIEPTTVEKVCMSIDVIPTVYNLFNIPYDSRLIMGKDIFSTTEGIAIMKNRSWVTNKGTYYSSSGKFVPTGEDVSDEYINLINQIVNNRMTISKMIVSNNYYKSIKINN